MDGYGLKCKVDSSVGSDAARVMVRTLFGEKPLNVDNNHWRQKTQAAGVIPLKAKQVKKLPVGICCVTGPFHGFKLVRRDQLISH